MQDKEIRINEMNLRIPGIQQDEAEEIGQNALQAVSSALPETFKKEYLEKLDIKVTIPTGTAGSGMSKFIAEAILKQL
ncbi:MAG: hypothetical protein NTU98_00110 [Bacteroidetes bacterium]|nr:hypothetical protein [Bacteroidota bacterium]